MSDSHRQRQLGGCERRERVEALPEARCNTLASPETTPDRVAVPDHGRDAGDVRSQTLVETPTDCTRRIPLRHIGDDDRTTDRAQLTEGIQPARVPAPL